MTSVHDRNRARVARFRSALQSTDASTVRHAIFALFAPDARIRLGHPFGEMTGPEALWDQVYAPLFAAVPDMERRDFIAMAGPRWGGEPGDWVGLGGNIVGHLTGPWLGIPPTTAPVFMRYQEYLRIEDGVVVEMEGLWDIPEVMRQAGVWTMPGQRGVGWMCPGPGDGRGVLEGPHDPEQSEVSVRRVWEMLHDLKQGTAATPGRGLGGYWHDHAMWIGPAGLGTARGHEGIADRIFRQFREGLSDNTRHLEAGVFFGDGHLVAFTGWPSGTALHTGDGFLGVPATGQRLERRSLDFWRLEGGLVRECWVMVDVIDLYRQMGIDVLARLEDRAAT